MQEIYIHANLIWNTIGEAVNMVTENEYNSLQYKSYIENKYELNIQINKIKSTLLDSSKAQNDIVIQQPLVTIGIINYNGKKYLSRCIDSFINQTYANIEILLIDDYSTDGSKEIIKAYENKYKNIRAIYHSTNSGGASKGIQEIIASARGKYFQWIACDDFDESNAIYKFVDYLEKNTEKDYVFSDFNIVDENNIKTSSSGITKFIHLMKVVKHVFRSGSGVIPMNCLYRLSFFKKSKINWIIYRE